MLGPPPIVAEWLGFLIDRAGLSLPSDGAPQAEPATKKVA
jgi:hypothetical protein